MNLTASLPIISVLHNDELTRGDIINLLNRRAVFQHLDGLPLRLTLTDTPRDIEVAMFEDEFCTPSGSAPWVIARGELSSPEHLAMRWDADGRVLRTEFKQGTLMESGDRVQDASPQMEFGRVTSVICTLRAVNDPRRSRPMVYSIDETIEVIIHPDNS